MTMSTTRILSRAAYAKEWGQRCGNLGVVEDAQIVLDFVRSAAFDMHDLLRMAAYHTVLRVWHR
jgi:hypothetical protein